MDYCIFSFFHFFAKLSKKKKETISYARWNLLEDFIFINESEKSLTKIKTAISVEWIKLQMILYHSQHTGYNTHTVYQRGNEKEVLPDVLH